MMKRTLLFTQPAYLSTRDEQLVIQREEEETRTIPIDDLGFVVLEHPQITVTHRLLTKLSQQKVVLVSCDQQHLPCSIMHSLVGHSEQSARYAEQINANQPLKKQLWQQTIVAKIENQAAHLEKLGQSNAKLLHWATQVKSGDTQNHEAYAAAHYFQQLFSFPFSRNAKGDFPNALLNYAYAILHAMVARAVVSTGLLPTLGIFHHNKYNPFCLADDLMEPYRPIADRVVCGLVKEGIATENEISKDSKIRLWQLPTQDVTIDGTKSTLLNAISRTTSSYYYCISRQSKKMLFPKM